MGAPPSGMVTFLFTDVEGSTRRWEEDPRSMSAAIAAHDELLTDAVERRGGYVFATGGDGFAVAFASVDGAVEAAVAGQRALAQARGVDLAVRMGIHTGSAEERDGNYFGPVVNRAARIMAAAHGGQVLASAATVTALGDRWPVVDLGRHRLRDLLAPEHLFLVGSDPSDHPPLRTLDAHDHNLPVLRSPVFGVEDVVDTVAADLADRPLVTLTGIGGVGKTRVALEVAVRELPRHEVTRFVDLSAVSDAADVVPAVGSALGVASSDLDAIASHLAVRRSLLVLDNCEHVLASAQEVAEEVLQRCPSCAVLATSREPLGVDGELVRPVRSLPRDRAVELFVERALSARPDAPVLGEADEATVAEICERLDGIPLAIELAAARTTHMSPSEIAAHLGERFRLLSGGRRRARQRQQTLQAAMDWSFDLLDEEEQSLLRAVAVFAGGFDADAAAAVWERDAVTTLDVLGQLVERSLLTAATEGDVTRFGTLETVRLYAQDRLVAAGEADARRRAHAAHFRTRLAGLDPDQLLREMPLQMHLRASRLPDLENHLAVLDWLDETGDLDGLGQMAWRVLLVHGPARWLDDSDRYLGRADVVDALDEPERTRYLVGSGFNANACGRWEDQRRLAQLGLASADGGLERIALLTLAALSALIFEPHLAPGLVAEALDLAAGDGAALVRSLRTRAVDPLVMDGQLDAARELLREQWHAHRHDPPDVPAMESELIFLELIAGDADEARRVAAEMGGSRGDAAGRAACALGVLAARRGDAVGAAEELLRGFERLDAGVRLLEHDFTICAAMAAAHLGDPERACRLLAALPRDLRTPGSFQLMLAARRLVRHHLDQATVERIRRETAAIDPIAVRRDELARLQAIAAHDRPDTRRGG